MYGLTPPGGCKWGGMWTECRAMKNPGTGRRRFPARRVFEVLHAAWGPQGWWPGETPLEVCVGAILTQNTAWTNVEKAVTRLRAAEALDVQVLHEADPAVLAEWIRPAGYFNVKARRLQAFTTLVIESYGGEVERLLGEDPPRLRERLLAVKGIGPETADSILLYAAHHPVFVVDAYTRRVLERHGWMDPAASYDDVARAFTDQLERDAPLFNEYHALIVNLGKDWCRPRPRCNACPLRRFLPRGGPINSEPAR